MSERALYYPYTSRRMVTYAGRGMVATSQQLAAQAGLDVMKKGGNAIDAAVATAACLTVVEPNKNGIGGDSFALVWTKGKLHGLNSSGPAPRGISAQEVLSRGYKAIPEFGWIPVTVPGVPAGWAELNKRFGRLPFTEVLKPAIEYAERGYPVSPTVSAGWNRMYDIYVRCFKEEQYRYWFDTYTVNGRAPRPGEVWCSGYHASTLKAIAETNAEAFYRGELADRIDQYSRKYGGYIRKSDLEAFMPEWVEPIKVNYRGYDVWEIPPNGQGLIALIALNILKGFEFDAQGTAETLHKQIEAIKLAFADGKKYITDSMDMSVDVKDLLSDTYASERRKLISSTASVPEPGTLPKGGTVYLATADSEGNMVSYIQSNYMEFGSGLVVPGTGIGLQNRGHCFSLDPAHDNCLKPGKRTYHTIIPGFLSKDDRPVGPFGVMGGFMQPQGHVQVVMNTVDFGFNPQAALDAPRWQWIEGKRVSVEQDIPTHILRELMDRGHEIHCSLEHGAFGHGQIIWRDEVGTLEGGTEPRTDGAVVGW